MKNASYEKQVKRLCRGVREFPDWRKFRPLSPAKFTKEFVDGEKAQESKRSIFCADKRIYWKNGDLLAFIHEVDKDNHILFVSASPFGEQPPQLMFDIYFNNRMAKLKRDVNFAVVRFYEHHDLYDMLNSINFDVSKYLSRHEYTIIDLYSAATGIFRSYDAKYPRPTIKTAQEVFKKYPTLGAAEAIYRFAVQARKLVVASEKDAEIMDNMVEVVYSMFRFGLVQ